VAPRGDVVVVYGKDFATCAHMMTPANQLVHSNNRFCTQARNVIDVPPRSFFNGAFVVGNPVKLCHGNNYGICSPLVTITTGTTLSASSWSISLQSGGTQVFTLDAGGGFAGQGYLLLGSLSGTTGFPYGALHIPLDPDPYFIQTLTRPNSFPLSGSAGTLDPAGLATASCTLPPLPPELAGFVLYHAFVVLGPGGVVDVSNPLPLTLVP